MPNPVLTVTVKGRRRGAAHARRPASGSNTSLAGTYQPACPPCAGARVEALLTDKYTQQSGQGFWLRIAPLPAPVVGLATPLPGYVGKRAPRFRCGPASPPPPTRPPSCACTATTPSPDGRFRLELLGSVGEAALLAARQSGTSVVDFPPVPVPADAAAGSYINLLLFGRTRHRMQAQAFAVHPSYSLSGPAPGPSLFHRFCLPGSYECSSLSCAARLLLLAALLAGPARPALAQKRLVARGWTKASGGLKPGPLHAHQPRLPGRPLRLARHQLPLLLRRNRHDARPRCLPRNAGPRLRGRAHQPHLPGRLPAPGHP